MDLYICLRSTVRGKGQKLIFILLGDVNEVTAGQSHELESVSLWDQRPYSTENVSGTNLFHVFYIPPISFILSSYHIFQAVNLFYKLLFY